MRELRKMPDWAIATVRCWRDFAKLPDSVSDDLIFTVVEEESLHYSSAKSDEENAEEVAYLRQELGLAVDI